MAALYLGVDPGLSGALALLEGDGRLHSVEDMPTLARGKGRVKREADPAALARLLRPHAREIRLALVEAPAARPGQGVASVFSLGHSLGVVVGVLQALEIAAELTAPSAWKKQAGLPADKELVRAAAVRLWPSAPLGRVKDHGRAEAMLLARLAIKGGPSESSSPDPQHRARTSA